MSFHATFCWRNSYLDVGRWGRLLNVYGRDYLLAAAVAPDPMMVDCKVDAIDNPESNNDASTNPTARIIVHYNL